MMCPDCHSEAVPFEVDGKPVYANPYDVRKRTFRIPVWWCHNCGTAFQSPRDPEPPSRKDLAAGERP